VTSKKSTSSNEAVLSFVYDDADSARRIERAIRPEVGDIDGDRSAVTVTRDGAELELMVTATDLVALRAGLNTWCSLVTVAEDASGVVE
jgi:KEOPS complex subunit Pcc1